MNETVFDSLKCLFECWNVSENVLNNKILLDFLNIRYI